MLDTIFLFLSAWLVTWPALAVFCLFGVWAEYWESRGSAIFWAVVTAVTAYFYFNVPLGDLVVYTIGYLIVGFFWSFYRYSRFVFKKAEHYSRFSSNPRGLMEDFHPSKMLDTITAWIIIWPFSLIENLCGDIINFVETLVKKVFKGVYNRIYEKAVGNLANGKSNG
jgi:hypothetical protein